MKHSTIGQSAPPAPLALADQSASDHSTRHDGWSPSRQATFLRALAATHSVSHAAAQAGMSRQSAYALRARLKGEPFDLAWHAALRCRLDALAEAALERALHGVEVQHFYHGELTHTSRRYDERLTVACWRCAKGLARRHACGPRIRRRGTGRKISGRCLNGSNTARKLGLKVCVRNTKACTTNLKERMKQARMKTPVMTLARPKNFFKAGEVSISVFATFPEIIQCLEIRKTA